MAVTIGICEDSAEQIALLESYLRRYPANDGESSEGGEPFRLIMATNPLEFLAKVEENKPHIVFLDIDMAEMNGIELGGRLKVRHENAVVIYITAHEQYALDAFRVRAFLYLRVYTEFGIHPQTL